jgi:hypothetical protein
MDPMWYFLNSLYLAVPITPLPSCHFKISDCNLSHLPHFLLLLILTIKPLPYCLELLIFISGYSLPPMKRNNCYYFFFYIPLLVDMLRKVNLSVKMSGFVLYWAE